MLIHLGDLNFYSLADQLVQDEEHFFIYTKIGSQFDIIVGFLNFLGDLTEFHHYFLDQSGIIYNANETGNIYPVINILDL